MKLSIQLGRDRYDWMRTQLKRSDHAILLVRVTADERGGESCRLSLFPGTAIVKADVVDDLPTRGVPDGLEVHLGDLEPDEVRTVVIECVPRTSSRPSRRKIGVVRIDFSPPAATSSGHVSTTVWTNVHRPSDREGTINRSVIGEWYMQRVHRRRRRATRHLAAGQDHLAREWFEKADELAVEALPHIGRGDRDQLWPPDEKGDLLGSPTEHRARIRRARRRR